MQKEIIGSNLYIDVLGRKKVPAKIDTGADSSAIWVSDIKMTDDGVLKFKLFGPESPFYTGKILKRTDYKVVVTRSSHGEEKLFYRTHIIIKINEHRIKALMTLADRNKNNFPILIGKRTISGKFLVDVSKKEMVPPKNPRTKPLNKELKENSVEFHKKYFETKNG